MSEAFDAGIEAHRWRHDRESNPHDRKTDEGRDWDHGWLAAAIEERPRYAVMFGLTEDDLQKVDEWLHHTVYPPMIESGARTIPTPDGRQVPYMGAAGGSLTYSFCNTTLGQVVKVQFGNGPILDLTDYDW